MGCNPSSSVLSSCSGFWEKPGWPWFGCLRAGGTSWAQVLWLRPAAARWRVFTHFPEPGPSRSSPLRGSITPAFLCPRRSPAEKVGRGRGQPTARGWGGGVSCSPGRTWSIPSGCTRTLLHLCGGQDLGGQAWALLPVELHGPLLPGSRLQMQS